MRFTIRDVLWLTALVALAVAWWLEYRSHTAKVEAMHRDARRLQLRTEQAELLATEAKVWSETSKARERKVRKFVEQLLEQLKPHDIRIEIDKSGLPVVTPPAASVGRP